LGLWCKFKQFSILIIIYFQVLFVVTVLSFHLFKGIHKNTKNIIFNKKSRFKALQNDKHMQ
jgi:hypothetical protein